jgi:predicted phosphoadenosine phosphosulfate sulfurtransferase
MNNGIKKYQLFNVYEAAQSRLEFIFNSFDNICVSFSGGKDSGLLLNLVLDYKRRTGDQRRIGAFHQDFEAQFQQTTDYVARMFRDNLADVEPFWECLPKASRTAVTNFQTYWYPWDGDKQDQWVRPMPPDDFIIHADRNPFPWYKDKMPQEEMYEKFGRWYHRSHGGKSIILLGIRANESLNRFRACVSDCKETIGGHNWTTRVRKESSMYVGYPIYDWAVEDVWTANGRFSFDYNHIYDLFYKAGLSIHQMRVASPFHEAARHSLNLYRVIDPAMWARICGRVHGANFAAIYGGTKAMGVKQINLPQGHTWKSYMEFLLATLPDDISANYRRKFATSVEFWAKRGGVLDDATISELHGLGIAIEMAGQTNYKTDKMAVRFPDYPDAADVTDFQKVPSYKRMCVCILKNDHLCKYMGFSQTKEETDRRQVIMEKYKSL